MNTAFLIYEYTAQFMVVDARAPFLCFLLNDVLDFLTAGVRIIKWLPKSFLAPPREDCPTSKHNNVDSES